MIEPSPSNAPTPVEAEPQKLLSLPQLILQLQELPRELHRALSEEEDLAYTVATHERIVAQFAEARKRQIEEATANLALIQARKSLETRIQTAHQSSKLTEAWLESIVSLRGSHRSQGASPQCQIRPR